MTANTPSQPIAGTEQVRSLRQFQRHYFPEVVRYMDDYGMTWEEAEAARARDVLKAKPVDSTPVPSRHERRRTGEWRCFHCNMVFTNSCDAGRHFGEQIGDSPECLKALDGLFEWIADELGFAPTPKGNWWALDRAVKKVKQERSDARSRVEELTKERGAAVNLLGSAEQAIEGTGLAHMLDDRHDIALSIEEMGDLLKRAMFGHAQAEAALAAERVAREKAESALERFQGRMFPLLDGPKIPWRAIAPFEGHARRNHGQTLERLAERGGLSIHEAIHVMECVDWYRSPRSAEIKAMPKREAALHLQRLVDAAFSSSPTTDPVPLLQQERTE